jgi:hypothetical protein
MATDESSPPKSRQPGRKAKFNKEQIEEIVRRVDGGESRRSLGKLFGVTGEAISQIYIRQTRPDEERRPSLRRSKMLTENEVRDFKKALDTTSPRDHGFEFMGHHNPDSWTDARVRALAKKVCGKVPSVRVLKQLVTRKHRMPEYDPDAPPPPPEPHDVRRLSPEMAADEEFVSYYLSDKAWQLRLKEYEYQLREWERYKLEREAAAQRKAAREAAKGPPADPEPAAPEMPAPGLRVGKHRASKGTPFTKPKRKKRR